MVATEKKVFIEKMKERTKKIAIKVIVFTESMRKTKPSDVVICQTNMSSKPSTCKDFQNEALNFTRIMTKQSHLCTNLKTLQA
jgi:hypothetical protein